MMKFKCSYYTIVSQPWENDSSEFGKCVAFAARTGKALSVTNFLMGKVMAGEIDDLPESLFLKLTKHEFLVPEGENELMTVLKRQRAARKDEATFTFLISDQSDEVLSTIECALTTRKYSTAAILWQWNGEMSAAWIRSLSAQIEVVSQAFSVKCGHQLLLHGVDLQQPNTMSLIKSLKFDQWRLRIDSACTISQSILHDLFNSINCQVVLCFSNLDGRDFSFLNTCTSEKLKNVSFEFRALGSQLSLQNLHTRSKRLAEISEFGIKWNELPQPSYGVYETREGKRPLQIRGQGFVNSTRALPQRDILVNCSSALTSLACQHCKLLPVCGGVSEMTWMQWGAGACPFYATSIEERLLNAFSE